MLNVRSIAVQGFLVSAAAVAVQGFLPQTQVEPPNSGVAMMLGHASWNAQQAKQRQLEEEDGLILAIIQRFIEEV
ncbi:MAG: hypothetical protein ACKOF9_04250 [Burkholderiales bacterium]